MASTLRAFVISLALVAIGLLFVFEVRGWSLDTIGWMKLKVINDTQRTVKIQPCWDLSCSYIRGLPMFTLRPGEGHRVSGMLEYENDIAQVISIGVLKPGAAEKEYDGCVIRGFDALTKVAVIRVAEPTLTYCPPESGSAGGG